MKLVRRIEEAALWAWPPRETARDEGWLLRAAGGHSRRANSVQVAGVRRWGRQIVERAIGRVEGWYARRGLPACFQLTDRAGAGHRRCLTPRWSGAAMPALDVRCRSWCCDIAGLDPALEGSPHRAGLPADAAGGDGTRCATRTGPGHAQGARGAVRPHPPAARRLRVLLDGAQPVAGAMCVVDRELAGIFSVRTSPPARGQGPRPRGPGPG